MCIKSSRLSPWYVFIICRSFMLLHFCNECSLFYVGLNYTSYIFCQILNFYQFVLCQIQGTQNHFVHFIFPSQLPYRQMHVCTLPIQNVIKNNFQASIVVFEVSQTVCIHITRVPVFEYIRQYIIKSILYVHCT